MSETNNAKFFKSLFVLAVLAIAMSQLLERTLIWNYQENSIAGAFTIYAIARALNAAISMLQGIDIDAFILSISIGELLDPINDLIERFSWIVMMAIASLGIQKVMLSVVVSKGANLLLGAMVISYLASIWFKPLMPYRNVKYKAVCIFLFIRFSLTMVFLCNYALDYYYFNEQKSAAQATLIETHDVVENSSLLANSDINASDSFLGKVKKTYSETKENIDDMKRKVTDITGSVENSISSLLDLIVFYILQTVLLPVAFLFFFYKTLKVMINMEFKSIGIETKNS